MELIRSSEQFRLDRLASNSFPNEFLSKNTHANDVPVLPHQLTSLLIRSATD
jgi:hypothetical protein